MAVDGAHRGQRCAVIAELAVIIVLDDPGIVRPCPFKQGKAAGQGERHAERVMARRHGEGEPRIGITRHGAGDIHAVAIDVDKAEVEAQRAEQVGGGDRAGILEPDAVARIGQRQCSKGEGGVPAGRDDDLFGIARIAPVQGEIFRDPLTQDQFPGDIAIAHARPAAAGHRIPAFAPDGERKPV